MGYINKVTVGSETHLIEPTLHAVAGGTASAIAASIDEFEAVSGAIVYITMIADNAANATLNINSNSEGDIYYNGNKITAGKLVNGRTYGFVYDDSDSDDIKWILIGDALTGDYASISHGHGNITNDGKVIVADTISTNKLMISDSTGAITTSSRLQYDSNSYELSLGTDSNRINTELYGTFTYNSISTDNANAARPIWFAAYNTSTEDNINGRPVYNNNFKYNPSTYTISIDTGSLSATQYTGNAATATKLDNGRTLLVALGSTSASTAFDGSANITDIGVSGTLAATNGGTGLNSYTLGDIIYSSAANTLNRLGGNTTTTRKFLRSVATTTGTATAPVWDTIVADDLPLASTTALGIMQVGTGLGVNNGTVSVTYTKATTTKYHISGTTLTASGSSAATFDTGIYSTTTAGELSAVQYAWNVDGTEKAYTIYDSSTDCINFIFV